MDLLRFRFQDFVSRFRLPNFSLGLPTIQTLIFLFWIGFFIPFIFVFEMFAHSEIILLNSLSSRSFSLGAITVDLCFLETCCLLIYFCMCGFVCLFYGCVGICLSVVWF